MNPPLISKQESARLLQMSQSEARTVEKAQEAVKLIEDDNIAGAQELVDLFYGNASFGNEVRIFEEIINQHDRNREIHKPETGNFIKLTNDEVDFLEATRETKINSNIQIDILPQEIAEQLGGFNTNPNILTELSNQVREKNLFLVGEVHGIQENLDLVYRMMVDMNIKVLGLEWPPRMEKVIATFLETGILNFEEFDDSADGRITAKHFTMIKKLHDEGRLDEVVCFDSAEGQDWNDENKRDNAMAQTILTRRTTGKTMLVLSGNIHSQTEQSDPSHIPMGVNLVERLGNRIPQVQFRYMSGERNGDINGKQKLNDSGVKLGGNFMAQEDGGTYLLSIDEATASVIPKPV